MLPEMLMITTERFGKHSEAVHLNGRHVADICGPSRTGLYLMSPVGQSGQSGEYFFPGRDDALAAVVSYATHGYWHGEV